MQTEPPKVDPPKRKRRWFQFSLRSLLIFTLIVAIPCAWLGRKIEQKRRDRETIESIVMAGGAVRYDFQFDSSHRFIEDARSPGPEWLRRLCGENFFGEVCEVEVKGGDRELEGISGWTQLQSLELDGNTVTAMGLDGLDSLPRLRWLSLSGITDATLAGLRKAKNLESLDLDQTKVSDAGLRHIRGLTNLQELRLANCNVTNEGMESIRPLVKLRQLWLQVTRVGDRGTVIVGRLPQLDTLSLAETAITDQALENIKALTHLEYLDIDNTQVTDAGLATLKDVATLRSLFLRHTKVTEA